MDIFIMYSWRKLVSLIQGPDRRSAAGAKQLAYFTNCAPFQYNFSYTCAGLDYRRCRSSGNLVNGTRWKKWKTSRKLYVAYRMAPTPMTWYFCCKCHTLWNIALLTAICLQMNQKVIYSILNNGNPMTLSDLQVHLPITSHFKYDTILYINVRPKACE